MVGNFEGWVGNEEVLEFNPQRLWDLFLEALGNKLYFERVGILRGLGNELNLKQLNELLWKQKFLLLMEIIIISTTEEITVLMCF